jgi:hypothetical protein
LLVLKILLYYSSKYLTIPSVVALLAEHSFWFSGTNIAEQFHHAVKSFEFQQHISITLVMAAVETAFNNATNKEDPAWLIHWVINNRLVCKITLYFWF